MKLCTVYVNYKNDVSGPTNICIFIKYTQIATCLYCCHPAGIRIDMCCYII